MSSIKNFRDRILPSKEKKVDDLIDSTEGDIVDIGNQTPYSIAKKILIFIAGVLFVILVWYLVAEWYNATMMKSIRFPDPASSFERLYVFFTTDFTVFGSNIVEHTQASLGRWIKGFTVALLIGLTLGIMLSLNDKMYQFGIVPVNILQMIPGLAWFPVTILLFGLGENSAIFIIAITVISPIAINVSNGLRRVPKVNMRVATMSGRTRFERFTEVLMPFAALDILMGIRIGMANGWRMLISAEMVVGVAIGLGFMISTTSAYLDYVSAFACIILICMIGLIIDKLILANLESYARRKLGMEDV